MNIAMTQPRRPACRTGEGPRWRATQAPTSRPSKDRTSLSNSSQPELVVTARRARRSERQLLQVRPRRAGAAATTAESEFPMPSACRQRAASSPSGQNGSHARFSSLAAASHRRHHRVHVQGGFPVELLLRERGIPAPYWISDGRSKEGSWRTCRRQSRPKCGRPLRRSTPATRSGRWRSRSPPARPAAACATSHRRTRAPSPSRGGCRGCRAQRSRSPPRCGKRPRRSSA